MNGGRSKAFQSSRKRGGRGVELVLLDPDEITYRKMPPCPLQGKWSPATRRWYRALQAIPTVDEWAESDWLDFEQTATIAFERFVRVQNDPEIDHVQGARLTANLGAELRHQLARFGIGPAERTKQRVALVSADESEARQARRSAPKAITEVDTGPRPTDIDPSALTAEEMLAAIRPTGTA